MLTSWVTVPITFVALIVKTPACIEGFNFGIFKVYLLVLISFSIWTPSLGDNSLPLINLKGHLFTNITDN